MYVVELHQAEMTDPNVLAPTLKRRLGGTKGFKTLAAVEERLVELAEDTSSDWEVAFAISGDGLGACWERESDLKRTGGSTDLELMYAEPGYDSVRYVRPTISFLSHPWNGSMTLWQAEEWMGWAAFAIDTKPKRVVFFDSEQRKIVAGWKWVEDPKGELAPPLLTTRGDCIQ